MLTVEILERQNKKLREENDELRETVRQLHAARRYASPLPSGLPYLTHREEVVIRALLGKPGTVTRNEIYYELYGLNDVVDIHIIQVFVNHLRKKLKGTEFQIETVWGRGYKLVRPPMVKKWLMGQAQAGVSDGSETVAA